MSLIYNVYPNINEKFSASPKATEIKKMWLQLERYVAAERQPDVNVLLFGGQSGLRLFRCMRWSEACVPGSTRQYIVLMLQTQP